MNEPLRLKPVFKERVWGGTRLVPGSPVPIGEAWVVYEDCQVEGGAWHGETLGDVAARAGVDLLGRHVMEQTGARFPLLIKLLHSLDWLSVQVHPNDQQAAELEGAGYFGKTEAWHVLEAEPDARVVYGLNGSWSGADLERLIQRGDLERALNFQPVSAGDTLFTPAGCVHAIGPGLFIYEVQQTSDITYRLYDWNRPASAGRALHLEQGLTVVGACRENAADAGTSGLTSSGVLVTCEYFLLESISGLEQPDTRSTEGQSFHALSCTAGGARIYTRDAETILGEHESIIIPASAGEYGIEPQSTFAALLSRVP